MSIEEHKTLVNRAVGAFNRGDLDAVDRLFAPDYVDHDRSRADLPPGPAGVKQAWKLFRTAFPDLQATIEDVVAEGDKVAVRGSIRGTHQGELMGIPPTGRSVTVTLIDVNRIEGGRLVERWAEADMLGMLRKLGVIPGPAEMTRSAVAEEATPPSDGDAAASKAVARRFVDEVINRGELAAIVDLVTATYVYHGPGLEVRGPEGIKGVMAMLRSAFPDWHETLEDLIAEGDKVVFRVTGHGTHEGEFFGIPATGRQVTMGGLDLVRVEGGRLAEHWANFDQLGLMQQLGAIPAPDHAGA
jgi:steroid delta-isomerase-like uncharacterized protein